jgi:hypothetical protein
VAPLIHRYPITALIGDYVRSAFGFFLTLAPMTQLPVSSVGFMILLPLTLLFAWLGWNTVQRHRSRVFTDAQNVRVEPSGAALAWSGLESIDLSYFSTRADRRHGWMQLSLRSGRTKVQVDSRISGFADIVGQAVSVARERALRIDAATQANFEAMGLSEVIAPPDYTEETARR